MASMKEMFRFENGGRTYTCQVEAQRGAPTEAWWWFGVSGDASRYAPFRAEDGDSEASVRSRVLAYYEDRQARRGWVWRDRGAAAAPPPPAG